eukprot:14103810-Ditylum_brightwellii.AAC.1
MTTCDLTLPMQEWDKLLKQTIITLNLLQTSQVNHKLSAYAYIFGSFNFNMCSFAPPGAKVILHCKPGQYE